MNLEHLLDGESSLYKQFRRDLRGRSGAYAREQYGNGAYMDRQRQAASRAFDAGVSACVDVIRAVVEGEFELTRDELETLMALRNGRAEVILVGGHHHGS
jgi:hypothetical protein